jgi:hypothetical protein
MQPEPVWQLVHIANFMMKVGGTAGFGEQDSVASVARQWQANPSISLED